MLLSLSVTACGNGDTTSDQASGDGESQTTEITAGPTTTTSIGPSTTLTDRGAFIQEVGQLLAEFNDDISQIGDIVYGEDIYRGGTWTVEDFSREYPQYAEDAESLVQNYVAFDEKGIPRLFFEELPSFTEQALPRYRELLAELQQLAVPASEQANFDRFTAAFDSAIEQIEQDPLGSILAPEDPFAVVRSIADSYDLASAAPGWPPPPIICHGCLSPRGS